MTTTTTQPFCRELIADHRRAWRGTDQPCENAGCDRDAVPHSCFCLECERKFYVPCELYWCVDCDEPLPDHDEVFFDSDGPRCEACHAFFSAFSTE